MQKSSRNRFPAAPLFQVQILALTAPAGTAWVTERSAYDVLVTCRLISLSSVPDEFRKSTPTPAHEGPPATLAQNWNVRGCPAVTGIRPERLRPPSAVPTRAAFAPECTSLVMTVVPALVQPARSLSKPLLVSSPQVCASADEGMVESQCQKDCGRPGDDVRVHVGPARCRAGRLARSYCGRRGFPWVAVGIDEVELYSARIGIRWKGSHHDIRDVLIQPDPPRELDPLADPE